jgi:hypothetical protein
MENVLEVTLPEQGRVTLQRVKLPDDFLNWQSQARLDMFDAMQEQGGKPVRMAPVHLPVLASLGEGMFPINLATRGIGVLPRSENIAEYTKRFRDAQSKVDASRFSESLPIRAQMAREFYSRPDLFDPYLLGGLEIFEGETPKNLMRNPIASLIYTGEAPRFPSYQLNGIIEFIEPNNPYYGFLLAARELFAFDYFHVTQRSYPYGYLFHPIETKDKTPFPRTK